MQTLRKKLLKCSCRGELLPAVKTAFGEQGNIVLQQPYEDDWLDVDNTDDLPDGGQLQFIRTAAHDTGNVVICLLW